MYADKDRQEAIVRNSGLDWVLNDKSPKGDIRALTDLSGFNGGTIARADVANFVLDQVHVDTWMRRSPLISW